MLQQKLETTQQTLSKTQEQLARVTAQREQAMELEKAAGVVASGLQKRLDNQESTIHVLRQSQDDALENLKHELQIRNELESRFDARVDSAREEMEKMRVNYEAQIESLRKNAEGFKSNRIAEHESAMDELRNQLKARNTRCGELESDATTYTQSIVKLDAQREQMQQELGLAREQMQAQLKQDSETIGNLQRERNDLREELKQLHSQMSDVHEQMATQSAFTTELEMSKTRVTELERTLACLLYTSPSPRD